MKLKTFTQFLNETAIFRYIGSTKEIITQFTEDMKSKYGNSLTKQVYLNSNYTDFKLNGMYVIASVYDNAINAQIRITDEVSIDQITKTMEDMGFTDIKNSGVIKSVVGSITVDIVTSRKSKVLVSSYTAKIGYKGSNLSTETVVAYIKEVSNQAKYYDGFEYEDEEVVFAIDSVEANRDKILVTIDSTTDIPKSIFIEFIKVFIKEEFTNQIDAWNNLQAIKVLR